jgi:hypothetical protein
VELALSKIQEALERKVAGIDNLRIVVCLVMDDLGVEPADDPG